MPVNAISLLIPGCGYKIDYSARFRGTAATAYLSRTPTVAGNRRVFTYATWLRRTAIGGAGCQLLGAGPDASNATILYLNDGAGAGGPEQYAVNLLHIVGGAIAWAVYGLGKLRDQAGWYHIVVSVDLTAASNKVRMWVNGAELSIVALTGAVTNSDTFINSTNQHWISRRHDAPSAYNDQMLADNVLLDGVQVSSPASFGALANAWTPKKPSGLAYGVNGSFLEFKNPASMGADTSGLGNHWTSSGVISTDQMTETPTNVFCTFDPLLMSTSYFAQFNEANLRAYSSNNNFAATTFALSSGKWYGEFRPDPVNASNWAAAFGVMPVVSHHTGTALSVAGNVLYCGNGDVRYNTASQGVNIGTWVAGDYIGVALDMDARTVSFYVNGVFKATRTLPSSGPYMFGADVVFSSFVNFGQRPWAYPLPAGFKAVCTANLPPSTPTIAGTFAGNATADGPRIHCDGSPTTLTINGNAVTWGTHADKLVDGFKIRTSSASYNASGTNTWAATIGNRFVSGECRIPNIAQTNL